MAFVLDEEMQNITNIKVVGVGGGGGNAVNRMIDCGLFGVEFISMNTDRQVLHNSKSTQKVQLGNKLTAGRGAGGDPEIGQRSAEESRDEIANTMRGAQMVFITAGMGGGTGTGAAPVVAEIAKEMGILTVGIVTKPFEFEGRLKMRKAMEGIRQLREKVDSLIVIPNARLSQISTERITMANAFAAADDILRKGVESISSLVNVPSIVNLDFADVRSVMRDAGYAHMGTGSANGENVAETVAQEAITSPLLETNIQGARSVIINVTTAPDFPFDEMNAAVSCIEQVVHEEANIIWGVAFDESMSDDEINITVIATGFDIEPEEPVAEIKKQRGGFYPTFAAENRGDEDYYRGMIDALRREEE